MKRGTILKQSLRQDTPTLQTKQSNGKNSKKNSLAVLIEYYEQAKLDGDNIRAALFKKCINRLNNK